MKALEMFFIFVLKRYKSMNHELRLSLDASFNLEEAQSVGQFVGLSVGRSVDRLWLRENREKLIFLAEWYNYAITQSFQTMHEDASVGFWA